MRRVEIRDPRLRLTLLGIDTEFYDPRRRFPERGWDGEYLYFWEQDFPRREFCVEA